ncbi:hypothetical protein BBO99_00004210 [Phytophthora kernoviae]|uniref:TFIIS N-terminal domain-containing protein n=2 Tax=Phytophthora kernoviae TaxID=325452 RepID=A0A3R7HJF1_9STRA|nr:hypothetical protein G195_006705 [Phytophthora kernoviae 00238/432]KAG2525209.1 hypothetical protein JM18_005005 [Phytophthora kernoviae]KAG2525919.1 hypothetical protein JM16_004175 [Phytophthora kernoviae]RLN02024.1 hypothetical protein BBI17_004378 [Phytophthora kernoviae]RLN80816.1 hypothetical protein BBO99_00004210 [Phytophthora kernoviae]
MTTRNDLDKNQVMSKVFAAVTVNEEYAVAVFFPFRIVRMREPQRYPLGTRVANPLEGRTGEISAFDPDSGLYTLKKVGKLCNEKQKVILNNKDLQPKRALEGFVEADGLRSLEGILSRWFRSDNTRSASLLVLKVLAMLPGVTEVQLRKTHIARTLRGIEKLSRSMDHIDLVFGDLAEWIIQKWARTAMNRTFNPSARDLLLAQQAQISRAGSDGQVHVASRPTSKMTAKQKETALLEALRTGAHSGTADGAGVDPGEEIAVYLPQFNSLGSEDMRRPVRQTQTIESLAAKINRDYEDAVRKHNEDDEENDNEVTHGRMVFGKPQLMHFSQNTPVIELFSTIRSKLVG